MQTTSQTPTPESTVATLANLRAAMPNAGAEFYVTCLDKNMTVGQARDAQIQQLQSKNDAQARQIKLAKARTGSPGFHALDHMTGDHGNSDASFGDPIGQFESEVRAKMEHGTSRERAVAAVINEDSHLHEAYLLATNPGRRNQRLIKEKFDEQRGKD